MLTVNIEENWKFKDWIGVGGGCNEIEHQFCDRISPASCQYIQRYSF